MSVKRYAIAAAASVGAALLFSPLSGMLDLANIVMLFLLVVLLVAYTLGRGPSVLATCLSVGCFDFFYVEPRFTFAIADLQYLITFAVMLSVGLITGQLTAGLRFQARVAAQRERRARALYEFARELSGAPQVEQVVETTRAVISRSFDGEASVLLPDADGRLQAPPAQAGIVPDLGVAQWAFDHAAAAGMDTDTLPASACLYLPMVAPMRCRGVLAIAPRQRRWLSIPEQRRQLDTFAALAAIALERVHYIEVAQQALLEMESERLRNSLLAALSHDLRTPLTLLVGLSESLLRARPALPAAQHDTAAILHAEARRMTALVANLLDMARIQSGQVQLDLQWQAIEEVVGTALAICAPLLEGHAVSTAIAPELPLLRFDAVLLERVLCNLLENAAKYTPAGARIEVAAQLHGSRLRLTVADDGPGIAAGQEQRIFDKFARGEKESAKPGVGLGLAICRAIVEAHGGLIEAGRSGLGGGGAQFTIWLPLGQPPAPPPPEPSIETES